MSEPSAAASTAPAFASSAAAVPALPPALAILTLAMLLSLQPVTTDLYLPALPAITAALRAPVSAGQMTLSAMLLAFGCSQMVWGPLSDRWGRRPILLTGLALYCMAALLSAWSQSMDTLIAWRVLQGAAMGAVIMTARAIVRDLYTPLAGARAMSKALTGLGVVACLCVPVGSLIVQWLGWRAALVAVSLYAAGTLAFVALRLPETLAQRNPRALHPATLLGTWLHVLSNPTFWAFSLLTAGTYCGVITFLGASPFIFMDVLGMGRTEYGVLMAATGLVYFGATFFCRALLTRVGLRRAVAIGGALSLSGALGMLLLVWLGVSNPWLIAAPYALYLLGHGIHQPCGQSGSVGPFPQAAGVASALNGMMMMVAAFASGSWLGRHLDGTVWPLAWGLLAAASVLAVVAWTLVQKFGEPRESR